MGKTEGDSTHPNKQCSSKNAWSELKRKGVRAHWRYVVIRDKKTQKVIKWRKQGKKLIPVQYLSSEPFSFAISVIQFYLQNISVVLFPIIRNGD